MIDNLHFVKELGYQSKEALEAGDLRRFAELMNVHWEHKKQRSGAMSNGEIDRWYDLARENGALGGKLIGAGGGGFLMFYAEDKAALAARDWQQTEAARGPVPLRFRGDQGLTPVTGAGT